MLVLSRQRKESIILTLPPSSEPTLIEIQVVDVRGDKVRLGTIAPDRVTINRKEIHQRMLAEAKGIKNN